MKSQYMLMGKSLDSSFTEAFMGSVPIEFEAIKMVQVGERSWSCNRKHDLRITLRIQFFSLKHTNNRSVEGKIVRLDPPPYQNGPLSFEGIAEIEGREERVVGSICQSGADGTLIVE